MVIRITPKNGRNPSQRAVHIGVVERGGLQIIATKICTSLVDRGSQVNAWKASSTFFKLPGKHTVNGSERVG